LLAAFLLRLALGLELPWLALRQQDVTFKLVTGLVLTAFIGAQWLLAVSRVRRWLRAAKMLYPWHQVSGSVAPLLFFAHSMRLGVGYLALLALVFFANHALALCEPRAGARARTWRSPWLASHVALSVLLVALGGYHVFTALSYE